MKITRVSILSGKSTTMDLPVTEEQLSRYEQGEFIQKAFPHLSADQREFIKTGITPDEWRDRLGG